MNKTGLIAKISMKYVLSTCIWKYFWRISRYFAFFWEFRGISRKYLNFAGPRPREISEAPIKETRQNRDSHIFAGRWIFCFWLASFKINSTIQLRLPGILLDIKNNIYYYYLHTMIIVFNR